MAIEGIVIVGGSHGALALARSVGASGGSVTFITKDSNLAVWSRHVSRTLRWGGPQNQSALAFLLEASEKYELCNHIIIAGGDAEVQFIAENHDSLSEHFEVPTPNWHDLHWLCDKPLLYERAKALSIAIPETYKLKSVADLEEQSFRFPLVLKPNMGGGENKLTKQKVIRINNDEDLTAEIISAEKQIGIQNLVLQELIPGDGSNQFSYAGYWSKHGPVGEFVARRTRQYPVDFGLTSTFVETVEDEDVINCAHKLLRSANFTGLIEIEFKRDQRDGELKLLDVNPRPWSWFGLCKCASLDLGKLMFEAEAENNPITQKAEIGVTWSYATRDIFAAVKLIQRKQFSVLGYIKSVAQNRCGATFKIDDPLPAIVDLPITLYRVLTRRVFNFGRSDQG